MTCEAARRLIDAYMDLELDAPNLAQVEAHLATCEQCRLVLESRRELSKAIKVATSYVPAPQRLRDEIRRRTQPRHRVRYGLIAVGVALAAMIVGVLALRRPSVPAPVDRVGDVYTEHAHSMSSAHFVDLASTDPRTLQTWFANKLDYRPRVPALHVQGFDLLGGRVDSVGGKPVPVLAYSHGKHEIDVFVTPIGDYHLTDSDRGDVHIRTWNDCGVGYWAVSDDTSADVSSFISKFSNCK